MKVTTRKTEEDIRREFFGPLKEAVRKENNVGIDPTKCWCELSEMRLMQLIVQFKPSGINRYFNLAAIIDHMSNIHDYEIPQCEMYLTEKNQKKFRQQQRELSSSVSSTDVKKRCSYPPKYLCRPNLEEIQKKIDEFYDIKTVDKNEGLPDKMDIHREFSLSDGGSEFSCSPKEERSSSVASNASKRRRIQTPED
ncbi:unnamed protein product [Caenorhabditis angaria]|uniref:Uncharacterized protein n=1 Tax=Caenorhabditis angaria TaxID=860376 RepID=A0A9P1ICC6_9PELO|nr:unnamed protein product [Caenorhabditis angaria]